MQWTFLVQAGVCGIRVLQNFVAEKNFLDRSANLGQPSPTRKIRISVMQKMQFIEVEFNTQLSWGIWKWNAQPSWIQRDTAKTSLMFWPYPYSLKKYQEPTGRRCQINSTVWTFPFTGVGGVTNMI